MGNHAVHHVKTGVIKVQRDDVEAKPAVKVEPKPEPKPKTET